MANESSVDREAESNNLGTFNIKAEPEPDSITHDTKEHSDAPREKEDRKPTQEVKVSKHAASMCIIRLDSLLQLTDQQSSIRLW